MSSAFDIDCNPYTNTYFEVDPNCFHTVFVDNDTYYWLEQGSSPGIDGSTVTLYGSWSFGSQSIYRYDPVSLTWSNWENPAGSYYITVDQLVAQDWASDRVDYRPTSDFVSFSLPAPMGSSFDAVYVYSPLQEVINLLPLVLPLIILFIGIRKGIAFIRVFLLSG